MASTGVRHRGQAAARLGLLVGVEVAVVVVLQRLGDDPRARVPLHGMGRWLASTPPGDATWAALRLLALAGAWWQLGSTLAYLAARASHVPALVAGLRWACLPGVRRVVDAALAVSIITGALAPAGAARATPTTAAGPVVVQVGPPVSAPGHAYVPVAAGDGVAGSTTTTARPTSTSTTTAASSTTERSPTSTSSTSPPPPAPGMPLPPPASPGRAPTNDPSADTYQVVASDNLWVIAAHHLAQVTGRPVGALSDAAIAEHWLAVLDANHGRWRSGNPNLIYPGEVVILPPIGPVAG